MVPINWVSQNSEIINMKQCKHTDVHMWLITLESSGVCAESINTVATLESLSERRDSIALLDGSACSAHKWSESSEESRHLDSVEMNGREEGCGCIER